MKNLLSLSAAAAVLALSACASAPNDTTTAAKPVQQEGEASLIGKTGTGTRFFDRSTDRNVRTIGNQAFKQDNTITSMGNEIARPSN